MDNNCPNSGAYHAATQRALHQLLDDVPLILEDPLALSIIDPAELSKMRTGYKHYQTASARYLRAFIVMRSRYTEDMLAESIKNGTSQYVILGAGLDTFAYRNPYPESLLDVFEIDRLDMQVWKKWYLRRLRFPTPNQLTYVPVDLETTSIGDALCSEGFKIQKPTFFSCLGVTQYLTWNAIFSMLRFVSSMPKGSEIIFEYILSPSHLTTSQKKDLDETARRSAARGESWITYFNPIDLTKHLYEIGFKSIRDFDANEANKKYFRNRNDGLCVGGVAHLMKAST